MYVPAMDAYSSAAPAVRPLQLRNTDTRRAACVNYKQAHTAEATGVAGSMRPCAAEQSLLPCRAPCAWLPPLTEYDPRSDQRQRTSSEQRSIHQVHPPRSTS